MVLIFFLFLTAFYSPSLADVLIGLVLIVLAIDTAHNWWSAPDIKVVSSSSPSCYIAVTNKGIFAAKATVEMAIASPWNQASKPMRYRIMADSTLAPMPNWRATTTEVCVVSFDIDRKTKEPSLVASWKDRELNGYHIDQIGREERFPLGNTYEITFIVNWETDGVLRQKSRTFNLYEKDGRLGITPMEPRRP